MPLPPASPVTGRPAVRRPVTLLLAVVVVMPLAMGVSPVAAQTSPPETSTAVPPVPDATDGTVDVPGVPVPETVEATIDAFTTDGTTFSADGAGDDGADEVLSEPVETEIAFSLVGFDLPEGQPLRFRTSVDGTEWTQWQATEPSDEGPDAESIAVDGIVTTSPVWVREGRWLQIATPDPAKVRAHLIDTLGLTKGETDLVATAGAALDDPALAAGADGAEGSVTADAADEPVYAAAAARPVIISRASWGADESVTRNPSIAGRARHVVIHHTASTNNYSAAEAPAQVRSFHRYHTVSRGWSDIGYNFLVDKYGRIYEGRRGGVERAVIGAHARGFNTESIGVALIGNFDTGTPTSAAMAAVRKLLAWKMGLHGINPKADVWVESGGSPQYPSGKWVELPTINGHRDTGLTSCPGRNLYSLLSGLRSQVDSEMRQRAMSSDEYARRCLPEGNPSVGPVWRAKGANRIATAVTASKWYWRSAGVAVVANANDFPDALAAGAIAAREDAPLLLTGAKSLHSAVKARLKEMGVRRAILMGGEAALSARVAADVRGLGITVERVAGSNRFTTAAAAAARAGVPAGEVSLALGSHKTASRAWPDAVAAGALAATPQRLPTLLTRGHRMPADTAEALRTLRVDRVWILGGELAVSDAVRRQVEGMGIEVRRLAGKSRYGTSAAAAAEARRRLGGSRTPLVLASGANFPDALAGAAVAARRGGPLLLVPPCGLEQAGEVSSYLGRAGGSYSEGVILGSEAAASERVRWQIGSALLR